MMFSEIVGLLREAKKYSKKEKNKAAKSRVRTFDSIKAALATTKPGDIFTTDGADRLYVTSKGKWGKKSGRGKIAKGFTPGSSTPGSDFASIKKHAARTVLRHGKESDASKGLARQYGSRTQRKERGIGGKDGRLDKGSKK